MTRRRRHPLGAFADLRPHSPIRQSLDGHVAAEHANSPNQPFFILNDSRTQRGLGIEKAGWWLLSAPFRLIRWSVRRLLR